MLEYSKGYAEAGNERLAVYRDAAHPTFVASEFKSMIDRLPELGEHLPDLKAFLLGFPKVTIPNATSSCMAGSEVRPQADNSHQLRRHRRSAGPTVIAIKLLYARIIWTALDSRAGSGPLRSRLLVCHGHAAADRMDSPASRAA
jgi:hypothetical protein